MERGQVLSELQQYKSCDPETMRELSEWRGSPLINQPKLALVTPTEQQTAAATEAANRWTGVSVHSHTLLLSSFPSLCQRMCLQSSHGASRGFLVRRVSWTNSSTFLRTLITLADQSHPIPHYTIPSHTTPSHPTLIQSPTHPIPHHPSPHHPSPHHPIPHSSHPPPSHYCYQHIHIESRGSHTTDTVTIT